MKSILFSICFVALTATTVSAQTATQASTSTAQVDPRLAFSSKVNEFEAGVSRNNTDMTKSSYSELVTLMSKQMMLVHQDYTNATGDKKDALKKKMDLLQSIYTDTKMMSMDMAKNQKDMLAKFKLFQQNF